MFDVIVVGGGSAGAAAAATISEDQSRRVLLLEAGRDWRPNEAPHALRSANINPFMHDPAHQADWQWPGLLTRRTAAQAPRFYWRGRALGGSSVVNAQIAICGVGSAFDEWAESGCEGWSAAAVLPLFRALETDPMHPGTSGPLPVYRAPESTWGPVDRALRAAALASGYPWNPDLNDPDREGVSCYPINSRDGHRVSTNDAFIEPARGRPNLEIRGGAHVDRVLIQNGAATGVRVRLDGAWTEIAAREVLLCAGAIHSPAILMRSGLGPASQLQALGITVLRDMPQMGRNFMEHPMVRATIQLRPEHASADHDARHTNSCVTYSSGLGGGGFRDMMMIGYNHRGLGEGTRPTDSGAIGVGLYQAHSRGTLTLQSADPDAHPVVEENMLDDPRDLLRMRDGVRRLSVLAAHPAVAAIARRVSFAETSLSMDEAAALPDAELDHVLLAEAADTQHASGTCGMTAYEEPRGVVDPDLRVKGIAGLRVADASIMPRDCRANTHFTCVMIGLMAARLIARKDAA